MKPTTKRASVFVTMEWPLAQRLSAEAHKQQRTRSALMRDITIAYFEHANTRPRAEREESAA